MYHRHHSEILKKLFRAKPYQGAPPDEAKIIFVGLDANFDEDVEEKQPIIFPALVDYLTSGVDYWKKHGIHHPFLQPEYKGDGRFYHEEFARLRLPKEMAEHISFVELIDVPTTGTSRLSVSDLNPRHLKRLKNWIVGGAAQCVFVSGAAGRLMSQSGEFPDMPRRPRTDSGALKLWADLQGVKVLWHYHFSVYGRYEHRKREQLRQIASIVSEYCC